MLMSLVFSILGALCVSGAVAQDANDGDKGACIDTQSAVFAGKIYQAVLPKQSGNFVLSPYSVRAALGVAALGAKCNTADEITEVVLPKASPQDWLRLVGMYSAVASPIVSETTMFVSDSVQINSAFHETLKGVPHVEVAPLYQDNHTLAELPATSVAEVQCFILNSTKFSGRWVQPFSEIRVRPFHLTPQQTESSIFMEETLYLNVVNRDGFSAFSLPFAEMSMPAGLAAPVCEMVFLVPDAIDGLEAIEEKLSTGILAEWLDSLFPQVKIEEATQPQKNRVKLSIPRFTLDSHFELKPALQSLGIRDAFGAKADFSGMAPDAALYVADILHKTHIDVNEYGVDAAAETVVLFGTIGLSRALNLRVDRPFLYLLYDKSNKQVLFLGRCLIPAAEGLLVPSDDAPRLSEML